MAEFVVVKDVEGRTHTLQTCKIVRLEPQSRVDGYSFTSGHVLFIEDGSRIKVYDSEGKRISDVLTAGS